MPILDIQEVNGETLGYDTTLGKYVPVDPAAMQGNMLGNVGRAAVRGAESIGLGAQEMLGANPEATSGGVADLAQRSEAAARAAPIAEAIGQATPDVAASVGLGMMTGGLGFAATAGAEGALNAILGGIRPGTADERLTSALIQGAIGAAGGVVGVAAGDAASAMFELYKPAGELSEAAVRGAAQGLEASEAIAARQMGAIGTELQRGGAELRALQPGAGAGDVAGGEVPSGAGRSIGAAETPPGAIGARGQVENEIYAADDLADMDVSNPQRQADIKAAEDLGFKFNPGSYTKQGSGARTLEAINQAAPWRDAMAARNEAANQVLLNQNVAKAIGMPNWKQADVITPNDVGLVDADLANQFEKIEQFLPDIQTGKYVDMLKGVDQTKGLAGSNEAQDAVANMIAESTKRGAFMTSAEFMADRSVLNTLKTRMFNQGDVTGGEAIGKVIAGLDQVINDQVKRMGNKKVVKQWEVARNRYRMLQQIQGRGAISPTGDVNATTLFNNMNRKASAGGYGNVDIQGRKAGDAVRDSYVLATAQRVNAPNRPATGLMRIPAEAIRMGTTQAGKAALGATAGGMMLNSIWGR